MADQAERLSAADPDYAIRDLFNAIANNNPPSWTMYIQVNTASTDIKFLTPLSHSLSPRFFHTFYLVQREKPSVGCSMCFSTELLPLKAGISNCKVNSLSLNVMLIKSIPYMLIAFSVSTRMLESHQVERSGKTCFLRMLKACWPVPLLLWLRNCFLVFQVFLIIISACCYSTALCV